MSQGRVGANVGDKVGLAVVGPAVGEAVVGPGEGGDVADKVGLAVVGPAVGEAVVGPGEGGDVAVLITSTHTFAHAQDEGSESATTPQTWYSKQSRGTIGKQSGSGQLL